MLHMQYVNIRLLKFNTEKCCKYCMQFNNYTFTYLQTLLCINLINEAFVHFGEGFCGNFVNINYKIFNISFYTLTHISKYIINNRKYR